MKKFLLSIFSICLCAVCAFGLVACGQKPASATSTDTTKVVANGGISTIYNGELYFTNGTAENNGTHNGGTLGSVYKVAISEDGTIASDAKYTKVVDALVGQKNGSIFIFGDYLYYTAPSTGKNKNGEVQYNRTKFLRKDLVNGGTQELYATALSDSSETISYAYYKFGTDNSRLALVVYEKTSATLKSFEITTGASLLFSKSNVTSAVMSEKYGVSETDSAERYIFYTMAAEENALDTNTNRVFRIDAEGLRNDVISDSASLSLLAIRGQKLLLTATFDSATYVYAYPVTATTTKADIQVADANNSKNPNPLAYKYLISYKTYEDVIFVEDGDNISLLFLDGTNIRYITYANGTLQKDIVIYSFASTPTAEFVGLYTEDGVDGNTYLTYLQTESSKNYLYRLRVNFADQAEVDAERPEPTKLSTTSFELASNLLAPELVGDYVYAFAKDDDSNTLMYRANIYTPKELNDKKPAEEQETDESKLKITTAELVGGTKI
ncbi:MAG: hypothetical protein IJ542_01070 [Clostridia bacterium]|nr:hypothetical protein [Clostridia bacterium]